jgi:hypothetical protein
MDFKTAQRCFGGILGGLDEEHHLAVQILELINKILNYENYEIGDFKELIDYSSCVPLIFLKNNIDLVCIAIENDSVDLLKFLKEFWNFEFTYIANKIAANSGSLECFKFITETYSEDDLTDVFSDSEIKIPDHAFKKFFVAYPLINNLYKFYNQLSKLDKSDIIGIEFNDFLITDYNISSYEQLEYITNYCKLFEIHKSAEQVDLIRLHMDITVFLIVVNYPELCKVVYQGFYKIMLLKCVYQNYLHINGDHGSWFKDLLNSTPYMDCEFAIDFIIYACNHKYQFAEFPPLGYILNEYDRIV